MRLAASITPASDISYTVQYSTVPVAPHARVVCVEGRRVKLWSVGSVRSQPPGAHSTRWPRSRSRTCVPGVVREGVRHKVWYRYDGVVLAQRLVLLSK